jgi:hypothetical protein
MGRSAGWRLIGGVDGDVGHVLSVEWARDHMAEGGVFPGM